jgi:hypothetical protein
MWEMGCIVLILKKAEKKWISPELSLILTRNIMDKHLPMHLFSISVL